MEEFLLSDSYTVEYAGGGQVVTGCLAGRKKRPCQGEYSIIGNLCNLIL